MTGQLGIGGAALVAGGYATGGTLEVMKAVAVLGYPLLSSVALPCGARAESKPREYDCPFNFVIPGGALRLKTFH